MKEKFNAKSCRYYFRNLKTMLFKIKKNLRKEYINPEIEKEIEEKGFSVYNYISLKELFLTVQRDYLEILSKINWVFWVISIVIWSIAYIIWKYYLFFYFLFFVYLIIFIILLVKLIKRAFYFKKINNVIYTDNWLILGNKLYKYNQDDKIFSKLEKYEEMFEEFLSKPSSLKKIINSRKEFISSKNWSLLSNSVRITDNFWRDWVQIAIFVAIIQFVYILFLYFFYYFWFLFWATIFFLVNIILKIILKFTKNTEVIIKWKIEDIDKSFLNMKKIDYILENKINNFKDWDIFNISKIVEKNFSNFYTEIYFVFNEIKQLFVLLKKSNFSDFINFKKLEIYFKNNFNKPVLNMISMLKKYEELLKKQINLLKITQSNNEVFDKTLDQKEIILNRQLNILKQNIEKLEKSLI